MLEASTEFIFYPHQVIATHWGIRDANEEFFGPERSAPSRVQAAEKILSWVQPPDAIVTVGGDLNAYSGIGPQHHRGVSTAEVNLMRSRLSDSFANLDIPDEAHCSDQRIDYIFVGGPYAAIGPYVPVKYESCFEGAAPSDHPFVLVTLEPE